MRTSSKSIASRVRKGLGATVAITVTAWMLSSCSTQSQESCSVGTADAPPCCAIGNEVFNTDLAMGGAGATGQGTCGCHVPPPGSQGELNALTVGFGVPQINLTKRLAENGTASFTFTTRDGTKETRCALFGCQPEVLGDSSREASVKTIVNGPRCIIAYEVFYNSGAVFDLADASQYGFSDADKQDTATYCPVGSSLERLPTRLFVGCWSFGASGTLGASPLVPVSVSEISPEPVTIAGGSAAVFTPDATCSTKASRVINTVSRALSTICDIPSFGDKQTTVIGSCYQGICVPRCTGDDDCASLADAGYVSTPVVCKKHDASEPLGICLLAKSPVTLDRAAVGSRASAAR